MKKLLGILFHRFTIISVAILAQAVFFVFMIEKFKNTFVYVYAFLLILSFIVAFYILTGRSNPAYKIAWVVPIILFPIFGGIFYVTFGQVRLTKREKKQMGLVATDVVKYKQENNEIIETLEKYDKIASCNAKYLFNYAHSPIWERTELKYFDIGEKKFETLVEELKKAEHFIFMEYFIISEGRMWNTILDILKEKAAAGVDVRVIYDDAGCMFTLPYGYDKKLEKMGIKCKIFNKFVPIFNMVFNNRDHRKICVIDGNVGFTGGINLADEYINEIVRFGHWKDTAVMLKGDAVWNLTLFFLSMWSYLANTEEDYLEYRPDKYHELPAVGDGYVQPFADTPLDSECVGETVYLNMITKAQKYIYITTPYLVIDNEMVTALTIAAKNGVDVRIITPHIEDKWYVHAVTRSYYEILVESGVKIYEYTPGFIHAKSYICDDKYAVVGTINMDYRSLYLHFECGVLMCGSSTVLDVKRDFEETQALSEEITLEKCRSVPAVTRFFRTCLRMFAPLL